MNSFKNGRTPITRRVINRCHIYKYNKQKKSRKHMAISSLIGENKEKSYI